jgi:hypothetical protein
MTQPTPELAASTRDIYEQNAELFDRERSRKLF